MKSRHPLAIAIAATMLVVSGCGGSSSSSPSAESTADFELDAAAEQVSDDAAARMTELYDAAMENGETELNIITGLPEDMAPAFEAFEETFPGIEVTPSSLIGASLVTQLQSEKKSGNHVTDVLHNPNGQQYVDFAQPYEVVGMSVPDELSGSADELVDPNHKYTSPFIGFFGLGVFLPREEEAGLEPTTWADLADPDYEGLVGTGDITIPGPSQDAPLYLMESGALAEDDVDGLANNVVVKGSYGDAVAGLMQGEYPYMFAAPVSAIVTAQEQGAPVEFRLMDEDNYVVTHKNLLMQGAPHPNVAKLYLEFLNTRTAQEAIASKGLTPLNVDAAADYVDDMPWTSWQDAGVTEIVPAATIDAKRPDFVTRAQTIFSSGGED